MNKILLSLFLALALIASPCLALADYEHIEIESVELPLKSTKLRKYFRGYSFTVQNKATRPVHLINAQVKNGIDGSMAYALIDDGSGVGIWWAICGPVGLITFGIGWAVGLVGTPVYLIVNSVKKKKARVESLAYTSVVDLGVLNTGDTIEVKTLARLGTKPQLKLTMQDTDTKEVFSVSH
jgi:hypothetical protein